jgi:hypothetical protein
MWTTLNETVELPRRVVDELVRCLGDAEVYVDTDDPLGNEIDLALEDYKFALAGVRHG